MAEDNIDAGSRPRIQVAVALVFGFGGRILICKRRAHTVLPGYWEFPGGKCNDGESPQDCVLREVREETGLGVRIVRRLAAIEHDYPHARVCLHPFLCELSSGELQLLAVAEAKWIAPSEIMRHQFPEANAELVKAIAQGSLGV